MNYQHHTPTYWTISVGPPPNASVKAPITIAAEISFRGVQFESRATTESFENPLKPLLDHATSPSYYALQK